MCSLCLGLINTLISFPPREKHRAGAQVWLDLKNECWPTEVPELLHSQHKPNPPVAQYTAKLMTWCERIFNCRHHADEKVGHLKLDVAFVRYKGSDNQHLDSEQHGTNCKMIQCVMATYDKYRQTASAKRNSRHKLKLTNTFLYM